MYRQALAQSAMVGLCVGTSRTACRPPRWICWRDTEQGYEVWLELGLQTAAR